MMTDKKALSGYVIVTDGGNECRKYGAELLQDYIFKCMGVRLKIVFGAPEKGKNFFSVGVYDFVRGEVKEFDYLLLNGDGFRTVPVKGGLVFDAKTDRGLLYAVCDFIETAFGVRFLTYNAEYVPECRSFLMPETEKISVPDIARRTYLIGSVYEPSQDLDFAVKARSVGYFIKIDAKHGGGNGVYGRNNVHNFHFYVPFEVYGNDHPEFYRFMYVNDNIHPTIDLTNGITDDGRLDESMDVSVAKIVIEEMKKDIDAYPDVDVFNFTQEDGPYYYDSDRNRELEKKYGRSGILVRFCNVIVRELNKYVKAKYKYRVIKLLTFAYSYAQKAPVKYVNGKAVPVDDTVIADENLIIQMAFFSNGYYSYFDPHNKELMRQIDDWSAVCGQFWFWAYDINFHRYQYFYDSFHNIGDNMKGFKKIGVQYLLMQGAHECLNEWQCNMRAYVYNKLMWNGEQDADALLKEYRDLYYGPASDTVNRVIEHFHAHYKKLVDEGMDLWFITRGNCEEAAITPLPVLYKAIEIIEEGEELIKASDLPAEQKETYLKRLAQVKVTPVIMIFDKYFEYYPDNSEEDRQAYGRMFRDLCVYSGVDGDDVGERWTMHQYYDEMNLKP